MLGMEQMVRSCLLSPFNSEHSILPQVTLVTLKGIKHGRQQVWKEKGDNLR